MKNRTLHKLKKQFGLASVKGESMVEILEAVQNAPKTKREKYEDGVLKLIDHLRAAKSEMQQAPQQGQEQGPPQEFNKGGLASFLPDIGQKTQNATNAMAASGGKGIAGMGGAGGIMGGVTTLGKAAHNAFSKPEIDTSGAAGRMQAPKNRGIGVGMDTVEGAMNGFAIGGPIGGAVGAGVALGGGLLGIGAEDKAYAEANKNAAMVENQQYRTEDAIAKKGGQLDTKYPDGGLLSKFLPNVGQKTRNAGLAMNKPEPSMASTMLGNLTGALGNLGKIDDIADWNHDNHTGVRNNTSAPAPQPVQPQRRPRPDEGSTYPNNQDMIPQGPTLPPDPSVDVDNIQTTWPTPTPQVDINNIQTTWPEQKEDPYVSPLDYDQINKDLESLRGRDGYLSKGEQQAIDQQNNTVLNPNNNLNSENSSLQGFQAEELLRYAPTVGNIAQLLTLPDAETENYDRLDKRYDPQYADERSMQNRVAQTAANTRSAIQNASGGSQAATRASLLGSQVGEQNALSDAYFQMDNVNRAENEKAQQFNLGVDQFNQQVDTQETVANAQNRAARETQKQSLLQGALNDMGAMGKEAKLARILRNTSGGYNTDGTKISPGDQVDLLGKLSNIFKKKGGTLDVARVLFEK